MFEAENKQVRFYISKYIKKTIWLRYRSRKSTFINLSARTIRDNGHGGAPMICTVEIRFSFLDFIFGFQP